VTKSVAGGFFSTFLLHDDVQQISTRKLVKARSPLPPNKPQAGKWTETPGVFNLFIATKALFIAVFLLFRFGVVPDNESRSIPSSSSAPKHHCVTNRQTPVSLTLLNILSRPRSYLFIAEAVTDF
jgi:hypothetical protein